VEGTRHERIQFTNFFRKAALLPGGQKNSGVKKRKGEGQNKERKTTMGGKCCGARKRMPEPTPDSEEQKRKRRDV